MVTVIHVRSDFFPSPFAEPGDILTLEFGYPASLGSLWMHTTGDARRTKLGVEELLHSPTDLSANETSVYVCQRAWESEQCSLRPNRSIRRLFQIQPYRYVLIESDRPLRLAEGMIFDPVSNRFFVTTHHPTERLHVDLESDRDILPVRRIAGGFTEFRTDGIDITRDGCFVLLADYTAATIYVIERINDREKG